MPPCSVCFTCFFLCSLKRSLYCPQLKNTHWLQLAGSILYPTSNYRVEKRNTKGGPNEMKQWPWQFFHFFLWTENLRPSGKTLSFPTLLGAGNKKVWSLKAVFISTNWFPECNNTYGDKAGLAESALLWRHCIQSWDLLWSYSKHFV